MAKVLQSNSRREEQCGARKIVVITGAVYYGRQVTPFSLFKRPAVSRNIWCMFEKAISKGKDLFTNHHYFTTEYTMAVSSDS